MRRGYAMPQLVSIIFSSSDSSSYSKGLSAPSSLRSNSRRIMLPTIKATPISVLTVSTDALGDGKCGIVVWCELGVCFVSWVVFVSGVCVGGNEVNSQGLYTFRQSGSECAGSAARTLEDARQMKRAPRL
ncbi:hypothetical protein CYLTODRAFT_11504 [Cylindrobasidium torrendii FP15055 ss-10]|uniref:Uncharacterized protein n=1 Tax=Cylindrobasidium torrendii FP15055 ss-10 TaxID=1314674 RepID=A0A0D7B9L2_9AGAR|nr:hypothetical protein CYLTODRAFT_11504 [Cylindrobasidium torrendii FP15055 ss-10]